MALETITRKKHRKEETLYRGVTIWNRVSG